MDHGGVFGGMGFMGLLLIILVVYLLIDYRNENRYESNDSTRSSQQPLDILNQRYAAGEIDDEEYNRRKRILKD